VRGNSKRRDEARNFTDAPLTKVAAPSPTAESRKFTIPLGGGGWGVILAKRVPVWLLLFRGFQ